MRQYRPGAGTVDAVAESDTEPQPTAEQRLAAALSWAEVPEFSDDEKRELDAEFKAAQACARRFYGLDDPE